MGMYDTAIAKCPHCKGRVEFQSKAGNCTLTDYSFDDLPAVIAADIDGATAECPACGITILAVSPVEARVKVAAIRRF